MMRFYFIGHFIHFHFIVNIGKLYEVGINIWNNMEYPARNVLEGETNGDFSIGKVRFFNYFTKSRIRPHVGVVRVVDREREGVEKGQFLDLSPLQSISWYIKFSPSFICRL